MMDQIKWLNTIILNIRVTILALFPWPYILMPVVMVFQGTFNPYTGLNASEYCTPCTAGQYCGAEGLNATSGPCSPGYYCPPGQNSSRPDAFPCPVSHYCSVNSSEPLPCAAGSFMNHTHAEVCYTCDAGW